MSDDQWQTLRRTGTNHLVAISGLHVGLVSGIIIWLVSQLWRLTGQLQNWIPARNAGIVGGIAAAVIYAFLAGMTVPTRRALIMLSIFGVAVLCRKKATSSEVLSLALFAVLLFDPLSPLSSGFWLSFGAVLAIVSWIGRTAKGPSRQKPVESVIKYVKGWTSVQLAVCIGLLPILLFGFGQASLISPIANMIAIPIVGILAVPLGLLGLFVFTLGFEEHATHCFAMAIYVLNFLFVVLEYLADLPWAILETEAISMIQMFLLIMVVLFLFLPSAMPARATLFLWLLPVLLESQQARDSESFRYTMLEVGQGLASVIETDQHVLVYDTGPKSRSGFDSGQSIVVPYLQNQGIKKVDALVVSHNHNDHKGGYESLVARYPADRQWFGNPGNLPDIEPCVAGHKWKWDGVDFEFLWPPADANLDGNNTSCVLLVRSRFGALLLTGDIESEVEQVLTEKYGPRLKSDVIQVPHQGSKTSSTTAFLKHVNPDLALVSAGYLNRFSHPHLVVQRRYHGIGAIQYNTAVNGAVSVDFSSPISVRLQRETATKYWRQPSRPAFYQE